MFNSSQTTIDSSGYALIPAVTAYRYNNISLDPQGMHGNAEVLDSQRSVVPVAGAGVKVKFRTQTGTALLVKTITEDGNNLPMGLNVYNAKGESIGITGQGGQAYVRVEQSKGKLWIGKEKESKQCVMSYDITDLDTRAPLLTLTARCINSGRENVQ